MRSFHPQHSKSLSRLIIGLLLLTICLSLVPNVVQAEDKEIDQNGEPDQISKLGIDLSYGHPQQDDLKQIDGNRIETFTISMPQLEGRDKSVIVLLPADYAKENKAYPVFYLQGAEQVFINQGFESEVWFLNESFYQFFTEDGRAEAIIVGLFSDSIYHWEEYGPWLNSQMYQWVDPYDANRTAGGNGDAYLDFLIDTLKPEIDLRYRTLQTRAGTAVGGFDMGGLFSIYAGLMRPDVFSEVTALSPAIWFAEEGGTWLSKNRLINLINEQGVPVNVSFKIDVADAQRATDIDVRPVVNDIRGNKISFPQAYLEGTRALVEALLIKGMPSTNINCGEFDLDAWAEDIPETTITRAMDLRTYIPLVMKQGLDHFDIYIDFQNRTRRIWVYLPPDYYRTTKRYPVLYLHDAQHIFGSETGANVSDLVDWEFDEILDSIYAETGQGIIAVGIEFDYTHQWDEYMPWTNYNMDNWLNNTPDTVVGKGNEFLNFVIDDLKPMVDSRYRTLPDRENTGIGGGSRVALFSFYAGLKRPDVFSKVMAFSPAVWLVEGGSRRPLGLPFWLTTNQLVSYIGTFNSTTIPKNVGTYLYIGRKEVTGPPEPYPHAYLTDGTPVPIQDVYSSGAFKIRTEMLYRGATLKFIENKNGTHYPRVWRNYLKGALDWLGYY